MNATTKTGKSRYVFFSTAVKNAILQLLEHHPEKNPDSILFYSSKITGKPAETELFVRIILQSTRRPSGLMKQHDGNETSSFTAGDISQIVFISIRKSLS